MDALGAVSESEPNKADFLLAQVAKLASVFDMTRDLARRPELVERVLASKAAIRDPMQVGLIYMVTSIVPHMREADVPKTGKGVLATTLFFLSASHSDPDPVMRSKCLAAAYNFTQLSGAMFAHPDFCWDAVYGVDGATILAAFEAYDYDTHHAFLNAGFSGDWFIWWAAPCLPLSLHWGDMARVQENMDRLHVIARRIIQEPEYGNEVVGIIIGPAVWSALLWSCRMSTDQREEVATMMVSCQLTWAQAEDTVDTGAPAFMRPRGDRTADGTRYHAAEQLSTLIKCGYILMASNHRVSDEEIMIALPTVDEVITTTCTFGTGVGNISCDSHTMWNSFVSLAAVSEKLGRHDEALTYATAGLVPDSAKCGTTLPTERVLLQSIQARALAALGRGSDAGALFESAAEEAHRYGLFLFEAFALRDLKVLVLDRSPTMGHGDHGSRRLGAALRQLTGPAEQLTPLLDGLDAAELMAQSNPKPGYQIVYEPAAPKLTALQRELQALKVSTLRKRAISDGVDEDAMEEAADGDSEKKALIELIVGQQPTAAEPECEGSFDANAATEAALHWQVQGLGMKVSALRKRATADGVDEVAMEEAADGGNEKQALIDLIAARDSTRDDSALRTELSSMKPSALRKKAVAAGVDEAAMEQAADGDDEKSALVELLLAAEPVSQPASGGGGGLAPGACTVTRTVACAKEHAAPLLRFSTLLLNEPLCNALSQSVTDGDDVGSERIFTGVTGGPFEGKEAKETCTNSTAWSHSYTLECPPFPDPRNPFPVELVDYKATVAVEDAEDGKCMLRYSSVYETSDRDVIEAMNSGMMEAAFESIAAKALRAASIAELANERVSALRKRALAAGATRDELDDAADADDALAALTGMIADKELQAMVPSDGDGGGGVEPSEASAHDGELKKELSRLKLSQLKKRAVADGVRADQIDDADDSADPRTAVIHLILAAVYVPAVDVAAAKDKAMEELRAELEPLKTSQLK